MNCGWSKLDKIETDYEKGNLKSVGAFSLKQVVNNKVRLRNSSIHHSSSIHSVFHSFHGFMNSANWPACHCMGFIAQMVEHCGANAEATGSNPVEAPKNFFRATSQLLKLRFNCEGHILISFEIIYVCYLSEIPSFTYLFEIRVRKK